jgi:hypothetical protein
MTLIELTKELILLRKKPTTEERFKSYPRLLQAFKEALDACDDPAVLREVIRLDAGYYLLAGYRQRVLEKWLARERTPEVLRLYARQLLMFGDVDEFGQARTDVDSLVDALEAEADALEQQAASNDGAAHSTSTASTST